MKALDPPLVSPLDPPWDPSLDHVLNLSMEPPLESALKPPSHPQVGDGESWVYSPRIAS